MTALPSRARWRRSLPPQLWLVLALVSLAWPVPCAGDEGGAGGVEHAGAPEQRGSINDGNGGGGPGMDDEEEEQEEDEPGEPGVSSVTRVGRIVAGLGRFWHLFMAVLDCEAPPRASRLAAIWP